jgi:hypothetical protein
MQEPSLTARIMRVKDRPGDHVSLPHPKLTFIKKILHLLQCVMIFDKGEQTICIRQLPAFIPP